jgi:hypothetical protein
VQRSADAAAPNAGLLLVSSGGLYSAPRRGGNGQIGRIYKPAAALPTWGKEKAVADPRHATATRAPPACRAGDYCAAASAAW